MMAAFQSAGGEHPGFRRNHAKGLCVTGWFEGNGNAIGLSKAAVFAVGRVPVVGRFALAGGMPTQPDAAATVRGMALRILPPGGGEWRTGMNNIPVFPVNTAQGFYEQLVASRPDPASGKPNPAAMQEFLARHPETVRALALIRVINRLFNPPPPLPDAIPPWQRVAAKASHVLLYALMFLMPLLGWGMLSAAPYPIVIYGSLRLPAILPQNPALYAWLRQLHTDFAYLLFAVFLAHLGAALMHGLIQRDGVFQSMASWGGRRIPKSSQTR